MSCSPPRNSEETAKLMQNPPVSTLSHPLVLFIYPLPCLFGYDSKVLVYFTRYTMNINSFFPTGYGIFYSNDIT